MRRLEDGAGTVSVLRPFGSSRGRLARGNVCFDPIGVALDLGPAILGRRDRLRRSSPGCHPNAVLPRRSSHDPLGDAPNKPGNKENPCRRGRDDQQRHAKQYRYLQGRWRLSCRPGSQLGAHAVSGDLHWRGFGGHAMKLHRPNGLLIARGRYRANLSYEVMDGCMQRMPRRLGRPLKRRNVTMVHTCSSYSTEK